MNRNLLCKTTLFLARSIAYLDNGLGGILQVLLDNELTWQDLRSMKNAKGENILDIAIQEDNSGAVAMLLQGRWNFVNQDVTRHTIYKSEEVNGVMVMVENENAPPEYYSSLPTPLHKAAYYNAVKVAAYLIENGAVVDVEERVGDWVRGGDDTTTPLHVAAARGSLGIQRGIQSTTTKTKNPALHCTIAIRYAEKPACMANNSLF